MQSDKLLLQQSRKKLAGFFGVDVKLPAIRFYYSRKEINTYWKRKTAPWLCGWTKHGQIHILHPSVFTKESSHTVSDYPKVLRHEYSHLFYNRFTNARYPRWLNEGLACFVAGQSKGIPKERMALSVGHYYARSSSKVYTIGTFWVHVLLQKYGKKKFVALLKRFSNQQLTSAVFRSLFHATFEIYFTKKQLRVMYREFLRGQKQ